MAKDDDIETGSDENGEAGEPRGKKMGLLIVLAVLLLGGGLGAAYFFGAFDSLLGGGEAKEEPAEHAAEAPTVDEHGNPVEEKITYYDLPDFLVNLSTSTSQSSFLKMKISLELPSEKDLLIAQEKLPILQDHFNTYLRDLRATDLSGSAGMYRLREELLARAKKSLAPGRVNNILFREILVQ